MRELPPPRHMRETHEGEQRPWRVSAGVRRIWLVARVFMGSGHEMAVTQGSEMTVKLVTPQPPTITET